MSLLFFFNTNMVDNNTRGTFPATGLPGRRLVAQQCVKEMPLQWCLLASRSRQASKKLLDDKYLLESKDLSII